MQAILKINLSSGDISTYSIPAEWQRDYLGGASLAARLLYDHLSPQLAPLDPQAPLLFLNGPLSGTAGPAVGRFVVCGRSPATGLWGESNCGGFWGPELRQAGYDGLWIEGRASQPVYLWIRDGKVEVRVASHLWGLDTYQTQSAIEEELQAGKVRLACIGPAGEALIPFALVLADHGRVAGRTGMGALMGSKNLKAIAVQGKGKIPLADSQRYTEIRSRVNRELRNDATAQVLRELGTAGVAEYMDYLGEMPKKYFSKGIFGEELRISGAVMKESILTGVSACHACVIACGRVVRLGDGEKRKGPEYETLVGFGPNLMLNDLELVTQLGELCDRYGLDSISMSNTLGLAYRLFELGKIGLADTGGLQLTWGDGSALEDLITQTVQRRGFGAYLAQGARALGEAFGAAEAGGAGERVGSRLSRSAWRIWDGAGICHLPTWRLPQPIRILFSGYWPGGKRARTGILRPVGRGRKSCQRSSPSRLAHGCKCSGHVSFRQCASPGCAGTGECSLRARLFSGRFAAMRRAWLEPETPAEYQTGLDSRKRPSARGSFEGIFG